MKLQAVKVIGIVVRTGWVLAGKEFIERGRKVIEETLLDNSKEYRLGNKEGREQYVNNKQATQGI